MTLKFVLGYLKNDDTKKHVKIVVYVSASDDKSAGYELTKEVDDDEQVSQNRSATPHTVHVVLLFVPLEPHAETIFDEGTQQENAGYVGQNVFAVSQHLVSHVLAFRHQLIQVHLTNYKFTTRHFISKPPHALIQKSVKNEIPPKLI